MSDNDSIKRQEFQKLKKSTFFDEEKLPKVRKSIDEAIKELDEEVAEYKKIVEENDKKIVESVSYEQFLKIIQLS